MAVEEVGEVVEDPVIPLGPATPDWGSEEVSPRQEHSETSPHLNTRQLSHIALLPPSLPPICST